MKRLVTADNLLIATLWQQMLENVGIRCEVRNRFIGGAVGQLPADQVSPQLWIINDRDEAQANALLAELRQGAALPAWVCPGCGEKVEGQFFQCWKCETARG